MCCLFATSSASFAIPSVQFLLSLRICVFTSRSLALYSACLFSFNRSELVPPSFSFIAFLCSIRSHDSLLIYGLTFFFLYPKTFFAAVLFFFSSSTSEQPSSSPSSSSFTSWNLFLNSKRNCLLNPSFSRYHTSSFLVYGC